MENNEDDKKRRNHSNYFVIFVTVFSLIGTLGIHCITEIIGTASVEEFQGEGYIKNIEYVESNVYVTVTHGNDNEVVLEVKDEVFAFGIGDRVEYEAEEVKKESVFGKSVHTYLEKMIKISNAV